MNERRSECRFLCADLVRVDWLESLNTHSKGEFRTLEAVLEDISALGACVQVDEKIQIGAEIMISVADARLNGSVSYCVFRDYGYFVGIRFSEETKWSCGDFEPQHLTNLEELALHAGATEDK